MFLEEAEIATASIAFAQKFADIARRRKVLWGKDVFDGLRIDRAALVARERQVLLNLSLRMRAWLSESATHEDELAHSLTEAAGPLRASAACLAQLESDGSLSGREALAALADGSGLGNLPDSATITSNSPIPRLPAWSETRSNRESCNRSGSRKAQKISSPERSSKGPWHSATID